MQQAATIGYNEAYYSAGIAPTRARSVAAGAFYGFTFFFLTATVVAVWAAYDGAGALDRFFLLLGGVLAVLMAPLLGRYGSVRATAAILFGATALLTVATAALYLAMRSGAVQGAAVTLLGQPLIASDNQVAQILAITLPILAAALWLAVTGRRWFTAALNAAVLMVGAAALALTESRGALLGVGAAAVVAIYFWLRLAVQRRTQRKSLWRWIVDGVFLLLMASAVAFYMAIVTMPELDARLGVSAQGGSALSRIALWRDSLPLIGDYYFTGSGLGTAAMVYATYAYLLHVPYLYHAHNFYLQVALEQGVPALLAWLGMVVAAVVYAGGALRVANRTGRALLIGGFAALAAFLVHSLFEADLYFSVLGALVFYPLVVLLWGATAIYEPALAQSYDDRPAGALTGMGFIVGIAAPLLLTMLVPGGAARWEANLGAVMQTQIELGVYARPQWSFQDQVRRQLRAELQPAEAHLRTALQLDATQPTAHRRLGALALARGEIEQAKGYLLTAYAVAPHDRATRQMLGEVLALEGNVAEAVALWQGVDMEQGQLMVREWWYQAFGAPGQLEKLNDAIVAYQRAQ